MQPNGTLRPGKEYDLKALFSGNNGWQCSKGKLKSYFKEFCRLHWGSNVYVIKPAFFQCKAYSICIRNVI